MSAAKENSSSTNNPRRVGTGWQRKSMIDVAIAIAGFYFLLLLFFHPVVFQGRTLSPAADMVAAAGMYRMGETAIGSGHFPLWNPTLFCGIPMFASLQYALFTYPPEYLIRFASHIFGFGDYRIWIFHFLLASLFSYLLARHYGCSRISAWLAGLVYGFSPQLIVLADVGHGSKLMAMTYLPLIWLMMSRLSRKTTLGRAAALGVVFAIEILALHPQVAAYGAMIMGAYLIYRGIVALIEKKLSVWGRFMGFWAGAMALSLAISATLWVSVLDFARFSIRGSGDSGVAGGGVGWDYATGWSFHPLESITYIFPSFMGFGGQTYWGTVGTPQGQPFTHNPMYFGCVTLLLVVLAVILLPRKKWAFPATLGLVAWVLSFGKYLPILYGPFFHLLPLFNKFRAPVMGQILLLLAVALLAGMGFDELIKRARDRKDNSRLFSGLLWATGVFFIVAMISLLGEGVFGGIYRSFIGVLRPDTPPNVIRMAMDIARPDVARAGGLLLLIAGAGALALRRKLVPSVLIGLVLLVMVVDLWPVNKRLITFTPGSYTKELFKPEGLVKKIQTDEGKFRIHTLDGRYRATNWWSYFGLESTVGYFGAKMATYQKFMTATGLEGWGALYSHPQILDALNVRYIISSVPLPTLFPELKKQGWGEPARRQTAYTPVVYTRSGGYLYRNDGELPRARLIGDYRVIEDFDATVAEMISGRWNHRTEALLDRNPTIQPEDDGTGSVEIVSYDAELVRLKVSAPSPKLLLLADTYYPSGWKATLNGNEIDILRADAVLRVVAVPAGEHMVEFRFEPSWFYVGLWISIISIAGVFGMGILSLTRKMKTRGE